MTDETEYVNNTKKKRDLKQAFNQLEVCVDDFLGELVQEDMSRKEIEMLLMQTNRLAKKIKKYQSIYRCAYIH